MAKITLYVSLPFMKNYIKVPEFMKLVFETYIENINRI